MKQVAGAVTPLSVDAHATLLQLSCVCHLTRPFRHRQLRPSFALFVRSVKGSSHTHTHTHTGREERRWSLLAAVPRAMAAACSPSDQEENFCYRQLLHTHTHSLTHSPVLLQFPDFFRANGRRFFLAEIPQSAANGSSFFVEICK